MTKEGQSFEIKIHAPQITRCYHKTVLVNHILDTGNA